jgi:hypothetical protein
MYNVPKAAVIQTTSQKELEQFPKKSMQKSLKVPKNLFFADNFNSVQESEKMKNGYSITTQSRDTAKKCSVQ